MLATNDEAASPIPNKNIPTITMAISRLNVRISSFTNDLKKTAERALPIAKDIKPSIKPNKTRLTPPAIV